jgi:adenylate cyclase
MDTSVQPSAWVETAAGARVAVENTCTIGRSKSSTLALDGDKISRRHALIHAQGNGEYSLVDLGSANGTRLNGRRVVHPKALKDGDEIEISAFRLRFHVLRPSLHQVTGRKTEREIKTENCWLMLADIVEATLLMNRSTDMELPLRVGSWFSQCGEKIEAHGGAINKYLGDGWLAFWADEAGSDEKVAQAIGALTQLQTEGSQDFRLIVHCGPVLVGGMPSNYEDPLLGPELNFIFRVEKVAGALGVRRCLTEPAAQRLRQRMTLESIGAHRIKDFEQTHCLYTFEKLSL